LPHVWEQLPDTIEFLNRWLERPSCDQTRGEVGERPYSPAGYSRSGKIERQGLARRPAPPTAVRLFRDYERGLDQVLVEKPRLQLVFAHNLADQEIIGTIVAEIVRAAGHFSRLGENRLMGLKQA
jgi:hypothetical protein